MIGWLIILSMIFLVLMMAVILLSSLVSRFFGIVVGCVLVMLILW